MNQERLKQLFSYDPDTGLFTRLVPVCNRKAGEIAGNIGVNGYVYVRVDGKSLLAHRMAWVYVYGKLPQHFIDHKNRNPTDNRISNLRECTQFENMHNVPKTKNNTSGVKGVYWAGSINHASPWLVQVRCNGRLHYIGYFKTKSAAKKARREAAERLHGEFARHD